MSAIVLRWRLAWYGIRLGTNHPRVRAMFGRYVAAKGGYLTLASAGLPAHVAWERATKPGYHNRAHRKALGWA